MSTPAEDEVCDYCGEWAAKDPKRPDRCVLGVKTGTAGEGGCGRQRARITALEAAARDVLHHVRNALAPLGLAMQTPEGVAPAAHLFQELTADEIRVCLGRAEEALGNLHKVLDP